MQKIILTLTVLLITSFTFLSAQGICLVVKGLGTIISDEDTSPDIVDGTNFGTVNGSKSQSFEIDNFGPTSQPDLIVSAITVTPISGELGAFTVNPTSATVSGEVFTMPDQNQKSFEVNFNPSGGGESSALITLTSPNNACFLGADNVYTFVVSGEGQDTPIPTLSQWGLLIFGLLIMNISVFFVKRIELI